MIESQNEKLFSCLKMQRKAKDIVELTQKELEIIGLVILMY